MPRVLHAGGDATGARIELTLSSLAHHSRIHVQEYVTTTRLLVEDGRVVGVAGLVNGEGEEVEYRATHTILATGGAVGCTAIRPTRRSPRATASRWRSMRGRR